MNTQVADDPQSSLLAELAKTIAACSKRGMTPVLKCSRGITFNDEFYVALCLAVREASGCEVRLDLLPGHRLAGRFYSLRRQQLVSRLSRQLQFTGSVSTTIALSRTGCSPSEIVIGFAGPNDELPPYAKSIELAA